MSERCVDCSELLALLRKIETALDGGGDYPMNRTGVSVRRPALVTKGDAGHLLRLEIQSVLLRRQP